MRASSVLGIIFSNIYDENVSELTSVRTMGSVPFAGRYRLIDFVLSNMVEAGINKVGVSTKLNYQSLMDHLGSGKPWDLSRKRDGITILPPFNLASEGGMYKNRLEAVSGMMNYISRSNKEYILFSDCNNVCNLDYEDIIDRHLESKADITIAYKKGKRPNLENLMTFDFDEKDQTRIRKIEIARGSDVETNYSLNIIVIKRILLLRLIDAAISMGFDNMERDIFAKNVSSLIIRGYEVTDYARTIDSLLSYYKISMDLLTGSFRELFRKDRNIYTKVRDDVPCEYGQNAKATNSLIADSCIIKGTVENSILFRGVYVAEGAVVKNSIIMQDSYIGTDVKVNCAILDKDVVIKRDKELSGADEYPLYIGKGITV